MNKSMILLRIANIMPEWMYGRVFLAKMAVGYMIINSLAKSTRINA